MGLFGSDSNSSTTQNTAIDSSQNLADLAAGIQGDFNTITRYDITGDVLNAGLGDLVKMNDTNATLANNVAVSGITLGQDALGSNTAVTLAALKSGDAVNNEMGILTANALGSNTAALAIGAKTADNATKGALDLANNLGVSNANIANNAMANNLDALAIGAKLGDVAIDSNTSIVTKALDIAGGVQGYDALKQLSSDFTSLGAANLNVAAGLGAQAMGVGASVANNALAAGVNNAAISAAVAGKSMDLADAQNARATGLAAGIVGSNNSLVGSLANTIADFAGGAIAGAQNSANQTIDAVTKLADSSQSRMADLVQSNAALAESTATGGGSTLVNAGKSIGIALAVALGLWAISRKS